MDEEILTDDPHGTKPTDIIGGSLEPEGADGGVAETVERPVAMDVQAAPEEQPASPRPRNRGIAEARDYIKGHPRGTAVLVIVSLIVVAVLALAWRRHSNLPDLAFIEQDARERVSAPIYGGGYFGDDDRLILTQVTVGTRMHSDHAPEGSELEETFASMGYVTADVMLVYQNESVIATKTAILGYAKQNQEWIAAGIVSNEQVSFVATRGVDQRKVLLNIGQLLERANGSKPAGSDLPSLATVYEGAEFEVTSSAFDDASQTDTLTIHARKGGRFSAYECDIVATFAFRPSNGLWELVDATVTDDAWVRRFDPLIGTWKGTFKSQDVSAGAKCLAGGRTPLTITITSWEDTGTGARIHGTISGVAHYHRSPAKDQNTTGGDAVLDNVPFTATLYEPENIQLSSEATFIATLPEDVGGTVSITLVFGTSDDGSSVTATVATEHPFEDTFLLIPYQNKVIFADNYELVLLDESELPGEEPGNAGGVDGAAEAEQPAGDAQEDATEQAQP